MKKLLTTAGAALALASASMVHAADAPRATAPIEGASEIGSGSESIILILLAILVGAGLVFAVDGDNDNPDSP